MHKKIQLSIAAHLRCIKQYADIEADLELCEKLFPPSEVYAGCGSVQIIWAAKSIKEVKERLTILAKKGILLSNFNKSDNDPYWALKGLYVNVYLMPKWYTEEESGATCRLVQVGTKPSEPIPIFKLVCDKETMEAQS